MSSPPAGRVEHVYREQGPKLWRALVLYSGDREVASEAVAEAFAQALDGETRIVSVERWVWRTAFLLARRMLSDRRTTDNRIPEQPYRDSEVSLELKMALSRLSPSQRAAVVLRTVLDQSHAQAAAVIGCSEDAARRNYADGIAALRRTMEVQR